MKELLFSVTKKDFKVEFMRAGGAGGQHQNTTDSACRITHIDSGAVGESRDEREQIRNKKTAFKRLVASKKFQLWLKLKASEMMMEESVEQKVERLMQDKNIKTEVKNEKGRWEEVEWIQIPDKLGHEVDFNIKFCPFCKAELIAKGKDYKGQKLYACGASIHRVNIDQARTQECIQRAKEISEGK